MYNAKFSNYINGIAAIMLVRLQGMLLSLRGSDGGKKGANFNCPQIESVEMWGTDETDGDNS